jgi:hypothetical protein
MSPNATESLSVAPKQVVFLLLITCLVYVQAVAFSFLHFDDTIYIVENNYVHKWESLPSFFTGAPASVAGDKAPRVANLYRPMPAIWVLLNYKLFGIRPALWHLSALALYLQGVWLMWRVATKLTRNSFVALASALLYGLHPTHVEGVAWVSGASVETLLGVLFFSAFLAYLRWHEGGGSIWLATCGVLTLLALFTKETALALPILMLAHSAILGSPDSDTANRGRSRFALAITALAAVGIYALLRIHALRSVIASQPQHSWVDVLRTAPLAFVTYIRHAFWPVHLAPWYDIRIVSAAGLMNFYLPLGVCIACAVLTVWAIIRKPLDGFLILWWTVSLGAPIVGIIAFPEFAIVQDRLSFVAVGGLAILLARIVARLPNKPEHVLFGFKAIGTVVILVVSVSLGMLSALQVNVWKSDFAMLSHAIEVTPMSVRPRVLLGAEYMKHGNPSRAVAEYRSALDLAPNRGDILYSYGIALAYNGNLSEAVHALTLATQVSPTTPPSYFVLADVLMKEGRLDEAANVLERGVRLNPDASLLRWQLNQIRLIQQRTVGK